MSEDIKARLEETEKWADYAVKGLKEVKYGFPGIDDQLGEQMKLLAVTRALKVAVEHLEWMEKEWWFEPGPDRGVCSTCTNNFGKDDKHDDDCPNLAAHNTLAAIKKEMG